MGGWCSHRASPALAWCSYDLRALCPLYDRCQRQQGFRCRLARRARQDAAKEWAATHPKSVRRSLEEELEDEIYGDDWSEDEEALDEDMVEDEVAEEYEDDGSNDQVEDYEDESGLEFEEDVADEDDELDEQPSEEAVDEDELDAGEVVEVGDELVEETYDEYDESELTEEPEDADDGYLEDYEGSDEYADEYDDTDEYDDEYDDAYDDEYGDEYDDTLDVEDADLEEVEEDEPAEDPYGLEKPETVRRGAAVLENLQVLPESCEIVYENLSPREEVIERIESERAEERALKKRGGIIGAIMGFFIGVRDGAARLFAAIGNFFAGIFGRRGSKKRQEIADTQTKAITDASAPSEESTAASSDEAPEASGFADTLDIDALDAITGEVQTGHEDPYGATIAMPLGELLKELRDNLDEDSYSDESETPAEDPRESQFKSQEDALLKELYEEIDRESHEDSVEQLADATQVSTFWGYGTETEDTVPSVADEEVYGLTDSQAGDELGFTDGAWADAFDATEAPVENKTPTDEDEEQTAGFFLWTPSDMEDDTDEDDADEQEVSDADELASAPDDSTEETIVRDAELTDWSDAIMTEPLEEATDETLETTDAVYEEELPLPGVFVETGHDASRFDTFAIEDAIDALEMAPVLGDEDEQYTAQPEAFSFEGFDPFTTDEDDELARELEVLEDEMEAEELASAESVVEPETSDEEPEPLVDEPDVELSAGILEGRADEVNAELEDDDAAVEEPSDSSDDGLFVADEQVDVASACDVEPEASDEVNAELEDVVVAVEEPSDSSDDGLFVADEQVDAASAFELGQDAEQIDELAAEDADVTPTEEDVLSFDAPAALHEFEDDAAALFNEEELVEQETWPVESEDAAGEDERIDENLDDSGYLDIDWADATSMGYVDAEFEVIERGQIDSRVPVEVVDVPSLGLGYEIPGLTPSDQLWGTQQSTEEEAVQEEEAQADIEETFDESELTLDDVVADEESADESYADVAAEIDLPSEPITEDVAETLVEEEASIQDEVLVESLVAAQMIEVAEAEDDLRSDVSTDDAAELVEASDTNFDRAAEMASDTDDSSEADGDEEAVSDVDAEPVDDGAEAASGAEAGPADDEAEDVVVSPESLQDEEDAQYGEPEPAIAVAAEADAADELNLDDAYNFEDIFAELPLAEWEPLTDEVDIAEEQSEQAPAIEEQVSGVFVTRDDLSLELETVAADDEQLEPEDETEPEPAASEAASSEEPSGDSTTSDDDIYAILFEELPDAEWESLTDAEDEAVKATTADEQPAVIESEPTSETDGDAVEKTEDAAELDVEAELDEAPTSDADANHEERTEHEQAFEPSLGQLYPQEADELTPAQSVESEKASETESEQLTAEEEEAEEIFEPVSEPISDHEQVEKSETSESIAFEAASEETPVQAPEADENESSAQDTIEDQVTKIMPGLTFYDEPEISDEELANVDMTGLTVISLETEADIEDFMPSVVEQRPRPRAVEDPTWGKSNFKPSVQTLGRRAMLLDLPDPAVMASDPFVSDHAGDTQRMDGSIINEELNRRLELLSTAPLPMITPAIQATDRRDGQRTSVQMQVQQTDAVEPDQPKQKGTQGIGSRSPKKNSKRKMSFGKKNNGGQEKQNEPTNE